MLVLSVPVLSCPDHHVHHDHHDQHDQRDQHDHGNHGEVGGCTQGSWRLSGPNARALPRRSLWMMNNEWLTHTVTYIWRYRPALAAKMSLTDWVIGNREKQSNRQGASKSKIAEDCNRVLGFVDSLYIESILWTEIMSSASNTIWSKCFYGPGCNFPVTILFVCLSLNGIIKGEMSIFNNNKLLHSLLLCRTVVSTNFKISNF